MTAEENKERMRSWNESSTQEEGNNDNRIERRKKEVKRKTGENKKVNTNGRNTTETSELNMEENSVRKNDNIIMDIITKW